MKERAGVQPSTQPHPPRAFPKRQVFRRMYMWEQHGMSAAAALTGIMMGSGMPKQDYAPTLKQKVFARFFEHIGMGDHAAIINVIVTKVG